MASTTGIAPVTSGFARRRSDLTELRGQMASVVGLAPTRPGLKTRLLELLCIHGQKADALEIGKHEVAPHGQALTSWNPVLHGGIDALTAERARLVSEERSECGNDRD